MFHCVISTVTEKARWRVPQLKSVQIGYKTPVTRLELGECPLLIHFTMLRIKRLVQFSPCLSCQNFIDSSLSFTGVFAALPISCARFPFVSCRSFSIMSASTNTVAVNTVRKTQQARNGFELWGASVSISWQLEFRSVLQRRTEWASALFAYSN